MSLLKRKDVNIALKVVGLGATLYGLYYLYNHWPRQQPSSIMSTSFDKTEEPAQVNFLQKVQEHTPYQTIVQDPMQRKLKTKVIGYLPHIRNIHYNIILSLMKGNTYQGVVNMSFSFQKTPEQPLRIDYNGLGVKFLMVNGQTLTREQVIYINHEIVIGPQRLRQGRNKIEVVFENVYSFLNHGLSAYFTVDQQLKYSLRQQVIYSVSGGLDLQRMIPCLNCFNECQVQIQVLHPDTFDVFSNTSKSLQRLCSVNEYQKYPFLFDIATTTLSKSFKINESAISTSAIADSSQTQSSLFFAHRKKTNTHFYKQRLPSLHNLFIFSSSMVEVQPQSNGNGIESQLLLRYFCKPTQVGAIGRNIQRVHAYILDVFRRLSCENIKAYINKIDILFVADPEMEGYFSPGVLMLCETSMRAKQLSLECLYLVVRGLLGLLQLQKGHNVVTLRQILNLNVSAFQRFQAFRNFLLLKNYHYSHLKSLLVDQQLGQYLSDHEGHLIKYFAVPLKFVILDSQVPARVSFQLQNIASCLKESRPQPFWEAFLASFSFLAPLIQDPLVETGLKIVGPPTSPELMQKVRQCLGQSKWLLRFYSNQEISDDLSRFLQGQAQGLQQRLTQVKVKQKFKDYITEKYQKYLPIRSNHAQAQELYIQFQNFSQNKNFHHLSVLQTEINRVVCFGQAFIKPTRVDLDCSIVGWRLLAKLKIYPQDEDYYQLIRVFEGLP